MILVGLAVAIALGLVASFLAYAAGSKALRSTEPLWPAAAIFAAIHLVVGLLILTVGSGIGLDRLTPLLSLVAIIVLYAAFRRLSGLTILRAIGGFLIVLVLVTASAFAMDLGFRKSVGRSLKLPHGASSMAPTLIGGDRFLVDYHTTPARWDVIAFNSPRAPGDTWVSRVVGFPGETIEIIDGSVHVNGRVATPPQRLQSLQYTCAPLGNVPRPNGCQGNPISLGPAEYFVLGDNTAAALDSRYWDEIIPGASQPGAIPGSAVIGVARFIFAPFARARALR